MPFRENKSGLFTMNVWRVVKRKYKAGVKPKEITIGLLDHIKKFRLYLG